jgi:hypothetical protein
MQSTGGNQRDRLNCILLISKNLLSSIGLNALGMLTK